MAPSFDLAAAIGTTAPRPSTDSRGSGYRSATQDLTPFNPEALASYERAFFH